MNTTPSPVSHTQRHVIDCLNVKPSIDPAAEVRDRVNFLVEYLHTSGMRGFVLGISGGQDSTLAGRLAQLAVEEYRSRYAASNAAINNATVDAATPSATFLACRLPYRVQADEHDVDIAMEFIKPDRELSIQIAPAVDAISDDVASSLDEESITDFNRGNVKARLRMVAQYALAGERSLLVVGTDHAAENVTGFFTKYGDGGADVLPLWGLTKSQGAELLRYLGAPDSTWKKAPTADLEDDRPQLADEDALGVSYAQIDAYLTGNSIDPAAQERIEHLWRVGTHKRHLPATPSDSWWRPVQSQA